MTMHLGHSSNGPVTLQSADLLTHAVVLGQTGSGKTGATVTVIEEAVLSGASVIVVDPKGDLTNLALAFPGLTAEEFAPWVQKGQDPAAVAANAQAQLGDLAPNVLRWQQAAEVTVFSPGKIEGGGRPVNALPSFAPPTDAPSAVLRDRAAAMVEAILNVVGCGGDPLTDPANVFMTDVVLMAWKRGESLPLEKWASALSDPPADLRVVDGLPLDEFFPKQARMKVARALIGFRRQAARWLDGQPLNIASLIGEGRPKVSVFSLRHLTDESDRMFFTTMLFCAIRDFMFSAPASDKLRLLVVLDEAKGYLPPYPFNPPTKKPLCALLAQARAQGIGLVIGTQNPNDIDYKALSNVGTWFLGKLRARDCARDLESELAARGITTEDLSALLSRHFMLLKKDGSSTLTKMRWAYSYLRGPMNGDDLARLDARPAPSLVVTGESLFTFKVADPQSRSVLVRLVYRVEGETWKHAALKGAAQKVMLETTPAGISHTLVWDSRRDVGEGYQGRAWIAVELNGSVYSTPSEIVVSNKSLTERALA